MDSRAREEETKSHSRHERSGLTARGKVYAEPMRQRSHSLDERTISTYMGYRGEFVGVCTVQQSGESQYALFFGVVRSIATTLWISANV